MDDLNDPRANSEYRPARVALMVERSAFWKYKIFYGQMQSTEIALIKIRKQRKMPDATGAAVWMSSPRGRDVF